MRLFLLKANIRCSFLPNTSYYFPFWNIPLKTKNKPFKSLFPFRGGIIAINGKNTIEAKRGVKKKIFYKLINSFISFEILLNSFRLIIIAIDEKNITKYKKTLPVKGSVKYARNKKPPIIKAVNRNNLSLIMEYWNFNISNDKLDLFIIFLYRTDLFFYIINDFGFLIVLQPGNSPFGSFISLFPVSGDTIRIKTAHISKLFYSQIRFFKLLFKLFIIHIQAFNLCFIRILYQKTFISKVSNLTTLLKYKIITYQNLLKIRKEQHNEKNKTFGLGKE